MVVRQRAYKPLSSASLALFFLRCRSAASGIPLNVESSTFYHPPVSLVLRRSFARWARQFFPSHMMSPGVVEGWKSLLEGESSFATVSGQALNMLVHRVLACPDCGCCLSGVCSSTPPVVLIPDIPQNSLPTHTLCPRPPAYLDLGHCSKAPNVAPRSVTFSQPPLRWPPLRVFLGLATFPLSLI